MSVIDIVLGALIVYGIIKGFFKGLFVEVASLLALMLGVYGAVHFSNYASEFLSSYVDWSEHTMSVSSFVITFVILVFTVSLAGKALTKLADFAALGVINKFLGALFGGLKVALILSIVLLVFKRVNPSLNMVSDEELKTSIFYEPVGVLAPLILPRFIGDDQAFGVPDFSTSEQE